MIPLDFGLRILDLYVRQKAIHNVCRFKARFVLILCLDLSPTPRYV